MVFRRQYVALLTLVVIGFFGLSVGSVQASSFPENVDMKSVRATWLDWYNGARSAAKLAPYIYNDTLSKTALAWSETAEGRGYINHKRDGQKAYYDYKLIKKWFADHGVTFKGKGTLFTENIGWSPYSCTKADCTQEMKKAIRYTFDFYMAEKGKKYRPHYSSVMSSDYHQIGLGISVDEVHKKLYLTVHYAVKGAI